MKKGNKASHFASLSADKILESLNLCLDTDSDLPCHTAQPPTIKTRISPGIKPAKNTLLTEIPAVNAYKINGRLGGKSKPSEPATVIRPNEKAFEYPSLINKGKKRPPRARIVTPDPPVKAVKNPHKRTRITGVPPGIHPNKD